MNTPPTSPQRGSSPNHHAQEWFGHVARQIAIVSGKPITFGAAVALVVVWAALGPIFDFSDTWQLVINTGTTIVTFLMVFLIQNTQNRDTMAIQLKLAELILSMRGAEDRFAVAEEMTDEELQQLHEECRRRADLALESLAARRASREGPALASHHGPSDAGKRAGAEADG